jgi:peptide/nickel transport system substrate-binding protein
LSLILITSIIPTLSTVYAAEDVIQPEEFILPRGEYKTGGILTIPQTDPYEHLNAYLWTCFPPNTLMYQKLICGNQEWGVSPQLAKSWEVSEDLKTYTFYLNEKVKWSDGVPTTSEDVRFSFGVIAPEMPMMQSLIENIDRIDTPDNYTVVFHLIDPDPLFIKFNLMYAPMVVLPKHIWEQVEDWTTFKNDDPKLWVGNGPFLIKEWKPDEYVRCVANENFWRGRPYLDEVRWVVIRMRDMQLMALEKGEVNYFSNLQGNEVPRILEEPEKFRIYQTLDKGFPFWVANNRRRPGNDTSFRHAMTYMVDRNQIIDVACQGYAVRQTHYLPELYRTGGWIPPEDITHDVNVTKAAEILDEAGYIDIDGDGFREYPNGDKMELEFVISRAGIRAKIANILIEVMNNVGIKTTGLMATVAMCNAKVYSPPWDYDFYWSRSGAASNDPREVLGWLHTEGRNWFGFYNETYDELWEKTLTIYDPEELRPLIWKLQEILAENEPFVPMQSFVYLYVVDIETFDGWSKAEGYGPLSQWWQYYNIHLKGSPGPVGSKLTLDIPASILIAETASFSAAIKDDAGVPIEGVYIDFSVNDIIVGAGKSNKDGEVSFTWPPTMAGNFEVKATWSGSMNYEGCESTAKTLKVETVTTPSPTPSPGPTPTPTPTPTPNYTPYYIAAVVVAIVVLVAGLYVRRS